MVQVRNVLTRRSLALTLLVAFALDGCVTYPSAVATKGQDAATAQRDARECWERAVDSVEAPLAAELKVMGALGGAALGGALVGSVVASGSGAQPEWVLLAVGAGAALGFVIGSIAGTIAGADEVSSAIRAREQVFAHCMTERGYRLEQ